MAAAKVDRTLTGGERVTQFELLTAAAFSELARHEVEVAVIEAGPRRALGRDQRARRAGRRAHQRGPRAHPLARPDDRRHRGGEARGGAAGRDAGAGRRVARGRGARPRDGRDDRRPVAAAGASLRRRARSRAPCPATSARNFAAAAAAAEALLGRPLDPALVADVAAHASVPGRLQVVAHDPLTIYDGAHNAPGIAALAASVPEGTVAVLSILDDKDAAGMLRALLPRLSAAVFTCAPNPRALPPATLADLASKVGGVRSEIEPDPRRAVERARALAGPNGTVLATGSIYLVAELLSAPGERRASAL